MIELAIIGAGILAMAVYGLSESMVNRWAVRRRLERRIRRIGR